MQIILLEKVNKLGGLGDVVRVKDGFARNFLIPQRMARRATEANIAEFAGKRADLEKAAADIDGRLVGATVSTGMAFSSHGAFELSAMLLQADRALYRAKSEGRNRLAVAIPEAATSDEQEPPSGDKMAPLTRHSAAA